MNVVIRFQYRKEVNVGVKAQEKEKIEEKNAKKH